MDDSGQGMAKGLETLNAQVRELEELIAKNVGKLLEAE